MPYRRRYLPILHNICNMNFISDHPHGQRFIFASDTTTAINTLKTIKDQYDVVILDCPPNLSLTSVNAMMAADLFLIPVDGGSFSLNGLADQQLS